MATKVLGYRIVQLNKTEISCNNNIYLNHPLFLQRTISLRNEGRAERAAPPPPPSSSSTTKTRVISATLSNPSSSMTAPRVSTAAASASKRRDSKLWSETFDVRLGAAQPLSPKEIKRQEVKSSEFLSVFFFICHMSSGT